MENNIFLRNKKKFNPDVLSKLKSHDNERKTTKFTRVNTIYNPITNITPEQIKKQDDLKININENVNIRERLIQIEKDRKLQDIQYKPIAQKITQDNMNSQINNFDDMKKTATNHTNNSDKNKLNNILAGLKDMGIISK